MENPRRKSCHPCRVAKTRCTLALPSCLRCMKKNLDCEYDARRGTSSNSIPNQRNDEHFGVRSWALGSRPFAPSPQRSRTPEQTGRGNERLPSLGFEVLDDEMLDSGVFGLPVDGNLFASNEGGTGTPPEQPRIVEMHGSTQDTSIPGSENTSEEICWFSPVLSFPSTFPPLDKETGFSFKTPQRRFPTQITNNHPPTDIQNMAWWLMQTTSFNMSQWGLLDQNLPGLLARTKETKLASMIAGNSTFGVMKSFVKDYGRGQRPGFIHGHRELREDEGVIFGNCRSILGMYERRTKACIGLVNQTLLIEVKRLYDEYRGYEEEMVLKALQAMTLYLLLLAADEDRCIIVGLVVTIAMGEIAADIQNSLNLNLSTPQATFPKWEDWILMQSKIRTLTTLHIASQILNLSVTPSSPSSSSPSTQPNKPPCQTLLNIPLPCTRTLWEAKTSGEWEEGYKSYLRGRKGTGEVKIGVLKNLGKEEGNAGLNDGAVDIATKADLETWSGDLDAFGGMVLGGVLGGG